MQHILTHLDTLERDQLREVLVYTQQKINEYGNSGFKVGQKVLIGGLHAYKKPFLDNIDGIELDAYTYAVGKYGYVKSNELHLYDTDEEGNNIYSVHITLEEDMVKKRRPSYSVHPDDVITL